MRRWKFNGFFTLELVMKMTGKKTEMLTAKIEYLIQLNCTVPLAFNEFRRSFFVCVLARHYKFSFWNEMPAAIVFHSNRLRLEQRLLSKEKYQLHLLIITENPRRMVNKFSFSFYYSLQDYRPDTIRTNGGTKNSSSKTDFHFTLCISTFILSLFA